MNNIVKVKTVDRSVVPNIKGMTAINLSTQSRTRKASAAESLNTGSMKINVTPPSKNMLCDRKAYLDTDTVIAVNVTIGAITANKPIIDLKNIAPNAFPVSSMLQSYGIVYNSQQITTKIEDHFDLVQLLSSSRKFRQQAVAPSQRRLFLNPEQGIETSAGQYGNMEQALFGGEMPNGAFPIAYCLEDGTLLKGPGQYTSGGIIVKYVNGIPVVNDLTVADVVTVYLKMTTQEPIFSSPFIYNDDDSNNPLFNMDSLELELKFKSGPLTPFIFNNSTSANAVNSISILAFTKCVLNLDFMKPMLTEDLPRTVFNNMYAFNTRKNHFFQQ